MLLIKENGDIYVMSYDVTHLSDSTSRKSNVNDLVSGSNF